MFENTLKNSILIVILMLLSVGMIMVYSTSSIVAQMDPATGNPYFFIKKQILWMLIAGLALLICSDIPYKFFYKHAYTFFGISLFFLILVLIPGIGVKYNGARRWMRMAGMGIQPSDFTKLASVLFIAAYIERNYAQIKNFYVGFLPVFSLVSFSCFLILIEPDLGTSCFIFLVGILLLLTGGIRWQHLMPLFLAGIPVFLILAIFKLQHIYARIAIYLNPELDPLGKGYQIRQSLIALGSGGSLGLGLGASQQKLFFLSEESTDFIFAILGEELGFLGTAVILIFYAFFLYYGLRVVQKAPDIFSMILALGITLNITLQAVFNIAVVTHTIPAKGISLPLISFGGSGLFFTLVQIGILLNISGKCQT